MFCKGPNVYVDSIVPVVTTTLKEVTQPSNQDKKEGGTLVHVAVT